jgi:hypothetical protein
LISVLFTQLGENDMKLNVIAVTAALAMTPSLALAQAGSGSGATVPEKSGTSVNGGAAATGTVENGRMHETTGRSTRDPNGGNPNGTAGGPTSLSGTGSSEYGGNGTAGTTNGR